jgi:hypothetical protein
MRPGHWVRLGSNVDCVQCGRELDPLVLAWSDKLRDGIVCEACAFSMGILRRNLPDFQGKK